MSKWILAACFILPSITTWAADPHPAPITPDDIVVKLEAYASVPDSNGAPARLSVLTPDPLGRLFVNDQRGGLYRIPDGSGVVEAQSYLDLNDYATNPVRSTSEAGFQSFAFHPDFATVDAPGYGLFYTIHSTTNTTPLPDFDPGGNTSFHSVLLEWRTTDHAADTYVAPNTGSPFREVLRLDQPFGNHNTGLIAFNPTVTPTHTDFGNLYIAVGDGGSGGDPQDNGQTLSNPYGAILRIDPLGSDSANGAYGIVTDNVFAADPVGANTLAEIYSAGLRNPQRYGWDPVTGNFYIADIGQGDVEEIDLGQNGGNFGWNEREGSLPFEDEGTADLIDPVAEYDHTNVVDDPPTTISNRAITVGEVARDIGIGGLDGLLLLGDFPTGLIFTLDVDNDPLDGGQDGLSELRLVDESFDEVRLLDLINEARAAHGLGAASRADLRFGFNTPGEVYILNKQDGIVRRVAAVPLPAPLALLALPLLVVMRTRARDGRRS